jgi:hypothetical protein
MDDRVLGAFVMGPTKLPAPGPQKVVGFSWTARQGGAYPMPYTNIVRIDAETMALIDNPIMWNSNFAIFYADFHPNDRGDLGGVADIAGGTWHPAYVVTLLDQYEAVPPGWTLNLISSGDDSPNADAWGDYNAIRRYWKNGYQYVAGGHVLQGGGNNADVESVYARFAREQDVF